MKWIAAILVCASLFIFGALYGIEKNNLKQGETPVHIVEKSEGVAATNCSPPPASEDFPWIVELAGGLGEGVAFTFNGVVLVLSEMIQAG
ncbi:hypothetical protein LCL89_01380 [Halobacillus yeomjeoni]|uniref:Uncharacterized protein n=1 Tax=Halobacillus yeomjeoni TaxID=311194 RepID=A0A931HUU0_9BACI|nr:hypothetical protein [Halobacillus yeomjeoni]MBH0229930.1 hypothetical protein [Halobacillus yeomjeoni]MCA0982692.1 hypothetical protein [Halobacillus yeomjeoni]